MALHWKQAFTSAPDLKWKDGTRLAHPPQIRTIDELKLFLDLVHVKFCLIRPYFQVEDYPLAEFRELLPSFDLDLYEHKELPGFSLVALCRNLHYFQEVFQFDMLHSPHKKSLDENDAACPLTHLMIEQNVQTMTGRLAKNLQDSFQQRFHKKDITNLKRYPSILPTLLDMERAHVMSLDGRGMFHLSGVYGSLPSDLDTELKRFGLKIGKFAVGDDAMYERNRNFVYQFLMELHGFPIVSERRTSASLFARRLFRMGENFLVRVMGQSDRTITTLYSHPENKHYPRVEKIALVAVDEQQKDVLAKLGDGGFFIDPEKRIVALRVIYRQHKYSHKNVRQDRALSVWRQEVIHPLTGESLDNINIIKDTYNMFLRLNDIVRGEYVGRIVYKRTEIIENTDTDEKRLKFLYAWLSKHQRRIIGYSDEFYANVVLALDSYMLSPQNHDRFAPHRSLYREVWAKYSYIQQARKVKQLEDLKDRQFKGKKIKYIEMLTSFSEILNDLKFEIVSYFDTLVEQVLFLCESILNDPYLLRTYIMKKDDELTPYGLSIKKTYGRIVMTLDEFKLIRKSRRSQTKNAPETVETSQSAKIALS
ncbi:hypothetical protein [Desulfovibrio inopinatus]|uniref:hypothetical protein n=1 Tax=Desulfovibrio inopinatus TaxID=102109 RepID=UPI000413D41F|nr:hypothetical protein [Desulfovibrio inopinatus]